MERLRRIARSARRRVDDLYRLRHGLQPVGPVLFVGRARYHGPARQFADGTQLRPGDVLGTLHFNNARIAELDAATPNAIASRFVRLVVVSLRSLAELAHEDGPFGDLAVFQGIGWWQHGERHGFIGEPFPEGGRKRFLAVHIGLLVWAFAPPASTAVAARPEPRISWITRDTLIRRYGSAGRQRQEVLDPAPGARSG
jgi:hypothetical protein